MSKSQLKLVLLLFLLCTSIQTVLAETAAGSNNAFGFKLLTQLNKSKQAQNIFISPLGIGQVLKIAIDGSLGKTRSELCSALALEDNNKINSENQKLIAIISAPSNSLLEVVRQAERSSDPSFVLKMASSIWANKNVSISSDFIKSCRKSYLAEIRSLDFADTKSPQIINSWTSEKTQGKITKILDSLNPVDTLVLLNATYFKAPWETSFNKARTSQMDFHCAAGGVKQVPTMFKTGKMLYAESDKCQILSLPYADHRNQLYLLLPKENQVLSEFIKSLNPASWQALIKSLKTQNGKLFLPKLKLHYESQLKQALIELGAKNIFSEQADLSRMLKSQTKVHAEEIIHKTYLDLNEEGTEAAAVTGLKITPKSIDRSTSNFNMQLDRPFVFCIANKESGAIIFMGIVTDPSKN